MWMLPLTNRRRTSPGGTSVSTSASSTPTQRANALFCATVSAVGSGTGADVNPGTSVSCKAAAAAAAVSGAPTDVEVVATVVVERAPLATVDEVVVEARELGAAAGGFDELLHAPAPSAASAPAAT